MASMVDTLLLCPSCKELYDDKERIPKMLKCQHAVCLMCLEELVAKTTNNSLLCPVCQDVQDWSPSSSAHLSEFPDYYMLKQLCGDKLNPRTNSMAAAASGPKKGVVTSNSADIVRLTDALLQARSAVSTAERDAKVAEKEEEAARLKLQEAEKRLRATRSNLQVLITKCKVAELNLDLAKAVEDLGVAESTAKRVKLTVLGGVDASVDTGVGPDSGGQENVEVQPPNVKPEPIDISHIVVKEEPIDSNHVSSHCKSSHHHTRSKKGSKKASKLTGDVRPVLVTPAAANTVASSSDVKGVDVMAGAGRISSAPTTTSVSHTKLARDTSATTSTATNHFTSTSSSSLTQTVTTLVRVTSTSSPVMSSTTTRPTTTQSNSAPRFMKGPSPSQVFGRPIQQQRFIRLISPQPHFINVQPIHRPVYQVPRYFINGGRWPY